MLQQGDDGIHEGRVLQKPHFVFLAIAYWYLGAANDSSRGTFYHKNGG